MDTDQDSVARVLNEVGLSDVEVSVYKAALALGSRPASTISQKSGLKRGHTYNVLQSLMAKGIVQEFVKNNVRHFTCSPPSALLAMLERKEYELVSQKERLMKVIPELEQLTNPLSSSPKVRIYKGIEGIKEVFEDMLRVPNQNIYGVCDIAYSWAFVHGETTNWINNFITRRAERNIWWLGIMNRSKATDEALRTRKSRKRRIKVVEGLDLHVEIDIYGDKTAITSTHNEQVGIVIESKTLSDTLRGMHRMVWNILPDYSVDGRRIGIDEKGEPPDDTIAGNNFSNMNVPVDGISLEQ